MSAYKERMRTWIEAHGEEMAAELQGFARIRSVSRADLAREGMPYGEECARMLDYALARARADGLKTENCEGHCGSATLGDDARAIGILAHLDVVPEGDQWIYPPYAATRVGDFLIGRGVNDDKAPAVMGLFLLRMFRELRLPMAHGIRLIFGLAEETGMEDIQYYVKHARPPLLTLVPDSAFPVNYAQKGMLRAKLEIARGEDLLRFEGGEVDNMVPPHALAEVRMDAEDVRAAFASLSAESDFDAAFEIEAGERGGAVIRARGVAAHAAHPEGGVSAIHRLAVALCRAEVVAGQSLAAMRAVAEETRDYYGRHAGIQCEDSESGKTTMVVGVARSQEETLRLHVDCRLSIAADLPETERAFRAHAASLGFSVPTLALIPPMYISRDDARVRGLQRVFEEVTGTSAPPYTMGGGTYARYLPNALTFGVSLPAPRPEGLPENHGGAHAPDEFLYLPNLRKATLIYAEALLAMDEFLSRAE